VIRLRFKQLWYQFKNPKPVTSAYCNARFPFEIVISLSRYQFFSGSVLRENTSWRQEKSKGIFLPGFVEKKRAGWVLIPQIAGCKSSPAWPALSCYC
jgi:hypothetical protein